MEASRASSPRGKRSLSKRNDACGLPFLPIAIEKTKKRKAIPAVAREDRFKTNQDEWTIVAMLSISRNALVRAKRTGNADVPDAAST